MHSLRTTMRICIMHVPLNEEYTYKHHILFPGGNTIKYSWLFCNQKGPIFCYTPFFSFVYFKQGMYIKSRSHLFRACVFIFNNMLLHPFDRKLFCDQNKHIYSTIKCTCCCANIGSLSVKSKQPNDNQWHLDLQKVVMLLGLLRGV